MPHTVLMTAASRGLGLEFTRQLLDRGSTVYATCRRPDTARALQRMAAQSPSLTVLPMDVTDEGSIQSVCDRIQSEVGRLHLVLNPAGVLHGQGFGPERKVEEVTSDALHRVFAVNAFGPILLARHALPLLRHDEPSVFASLSARVGSIEDNGRGGWYAYRASKAAQNQLLKTLSIELGRRAKHCTVLALHPGTVDTDLSKPFQKFVPPGQLFTVERAARQLLEIIDRSGPADSGSFFAWDGSPIPW